MPALIRYNSKTLRNPNFLTQLKEILSILPSFFAELSNLESSFKTNHSFESSAETLIYSFTLQIIKHFFMFASKKLDHYNESKEILTLFLRCEKLYVENQRNRIYTSKNNEILEKYTPTFIRFLYFIEYFHLNIVLKNKDLIIIESNDNNLLFPVLEIVQFLDILTNIFSSNLKKMSSFLLAFPEEKALLLRIYTFLSFMKTMNYVHNIENSLKLFPNEKVEKKVKDLMLGFEKMAADMRFVIEENNDSSKLNNNENQKRKTSVNSKVTLQNNMSEKSTEFNILEEKTEEKSEIFTKKEQLVEEYRRSSCKIIDSSGVTRNMGELHNNFSAYIASKTNNSLNFLKQNNSGSVINSFKLQNSENLPKNSILNEIYPSIRYYKLNHETFERSDDLQEKQQILEPNFSRWSKPQIKINPVNYSKEECEIINEKLSENFMKEILKTESN